MQHSKQLVDARKETYKIYCLPEMCRQNYIFHGKEEYILPGVNLVRLMHESMTGVELHDDCINADKTVVIANQSKRNMRMIYNVRVHRYCRRDTNIVTELM